MGFTTYTRDAIDKPSRDSGLRQHRRYGNLSRGIDRGGLYCSTGGYVNFDADYIATDHLYS